MADPSDSLFKVSESEYGESYREDYLTMYLAYVASADKISERRYTANSFFLTINSGLLGVAGYFGADGDNLIWLAAAAGVLFSYTWKCLIRSYRSLNTAKFKVIHMLEARLPFAAYDEEWVVAKRGKDKSVHVPFSQVESLVPVIYMVLHTCVFVVNLALWSVATF